MIPEETQGQSKSFLTLPTFTTPDGDADLDPKPRTKILLSADEDDPRIKIVLTGAVNDGEPEPHPRERAITFSPGSGAERPSLKRRLSWSVSATADSKIKAGGISLLEKGMVATRRLSAMVVPYVSKRPKPAPKLDNQYEWIIWWSVSWQLVMIIHRFACFFCIPIAVVFEKAKLAQQNLSIYFTCCFLIDSMIDWLIVPRLHRFLYSNSNGSSPAFSMHSLGSFRSASSASTFALKSLSDVTTLNDFTLFMRSSVSFQACLLLLMDLITVIPWDLISAWLGYNQPQVLLLFKLASLYRLPESYRIIKYHGQLVLKLNSTWDESLNNSSGRILHRIFARFSAWTSSYFAVIILNVVVMVVILCCFLHMLAVINFCFVRSWAAPDRDSIYPAHLAAELRNRTTYMPYMWSSHPQELLYPRYHPWLTLPVLDEMTFWEQYTWALYEAAGRTVIMFINPSEETTLLERTTDLIFDIVEALVDGFLIAHISLLIARQSGFARSAYVERRDMISEYAHIRKVPPELSNKVCDGFDEKHVGGLYFRVPEIFSDLSPDLMRAFDEEESHKASMRKDGFDVDAAG
ncbi:anaphase-promoting complex subunit Hcn1 [Quaeritorhiza haematococci]|nr:anaphase-promoting complex subunit Hcn1 [Quaeritorhiza haematococci]